MAVRQLQFVVKLCKHYKRVLSDRCKCLKPWKLFRKINQAVIQMSFSRPRRRNNREREREDTTKDKQLAKTDRDESTKDKHTSPIWTKVVK